MRKIIEKPEPNPPVPTGPSQDQINQEAIEKLRNELLNLKEEKKN